MMKYTFYVTASQSGGEGQGGIQTDAETSRHMNLIGQTGKTTGIETTHPIRLGFNQRKPNRSYDGKINL